MRNRIQLLVLFLIMTVTSCGYSMSGKGLLVPEGAKTIGIPSFLNNTNEPYIDVEITKAVVNEFLADGRLRVVDVDRADLALRGTVTHFSVTALSYTPNAYVQQFNIRLVVDVRLDDRNSNKTIWQERGIESIFIADYPVTIGDIRVTKVAKEGAMQKASQDIAWTLRSRVLEGF